jgi:hypothetical protein
MSTPEIFSNNQRPLYIHSGTSNTSFIQMSNMLHQFGVQNHLFMLYLYDPDLGSIDPHDPELSRDIKMKVVQEILINPWYYLREVVRIRQSGGSSQFQLNRGTLAMIYLIYAYINFLGILPRQTFKTFSVAAALGHIYKYGSKNTHMAFLNKDADGVKENLGRVRETFDSLPPWLNVSEKKDVTNIQRIETAINNNSIQTYPPAMDPVKADLKGRGLSYPILWVDEIEWIKYIDIVYTAMAPAHSTASLQAASNYSPFGKFMTTTPNYIDEPTAVFVEGQIIGQSVPFSEFMYDMAIPDLRAYIKQTSSNDVVHIEYTWQELGFTPEWYEYQCRNLNNDLKKIAREIDLKRTVSNDSSPYPEEHIIEAEQHIVHPYKDVYVNSRWILQLYRKLVPGRPIALSCDPAAGRRQDNTAILINDLLDMKPIAFFESNRIQPHETKDFIETLLDELFPNAIVVIESNFDEMLVGSLATGRHGEKLNWEYRVKYIKVREDNSMNEGGSRKERIREYGFNTNSSNRDKMFDITLEIALRTEPDSFIIPKILRDLRCLTVEKGKVQARKGMHDDSLMSWLFLRHMFYNQLEYPNFHRMRRELLGQWASSRENTDLQQDVALQEAKRRELMKDSSFAQNMTRIDRMRKFSSVINNNTSNANDLFAREMMETDMMGSGLSETTLLKAPSGQPLNQQPTFFHDDDGLHVSSGIVDPENKRRKKMNERARSLLGLNR